MSKVLIIRTSSLGDVAMLVPVMVSVASSYPQSRFTILTRAAFAPLFKDLAFNISILPVDLSGKHRGLSGLIRIIAKVLFRGYSHVADEHDVLRSRFICFFMKITGCKVRHIDKERREKEKMIATKNVTTPLTPTIDRYLDTFARLGFPTTLTFSDFFDFSTHDLSAVHNIIGEKLEQKWIGLAPFARHKGKNYPLEKIENIIRILSQDKNNRIILLGSKNDKPVFDKWEEQYPDTIINPAGKLKLEKELLLMSYMDVVISMDSANMHLASLVNVPVVSIWGATHPSLGFYGFRQDPDNAVQIDFYCRPCSVFGDKPCQRGDYACLQLIAESAIIEKVNKILARQEEKTGSSAL